MSRCRTSGPSHRRPNAADDHDGEVRHPGIRLDAVGGRDPPRRDPHRPVHASGNGLRDLGTTVTAPAAPNAIDHYRESGQLVGSETVRPRSAGAAKLPSGRADILVGESLGAAGELERNHQRDLDLLVADAEADEVETARHADPEEASRVIHNPGRRSILSRGGQWN